MMQDEMGLGWLDYGARFYDGVLGRWHAIDPFAEVYNAITPYHYAANNPIKNIDVKGKLLKDKDGNIIATSTGNVIKEEIRRNGVDVGTAEYQEVTIYTDKGTPIIARKLIEQSVKEGENDVDGTSNCHGWALGGGGLVIIDNDGAVNTILNDDGYVQVDGPAESDIFIEAFSKTDPETGNEERANTDVWHTGKHDKESDTYSADHNDRKPTENGTLESASSAVKGTKGIKTFFFKATKPDNLKKADVKIYTNEEAEKEKEKAKNTK
jgi:RHS repeat-associated protein